MGPVNTKMVKGRGDASRAFEKLKTEFCSNESLDKLLCKFKMLTNEEKEEISIILGKKDVEALLMEKDRMDFFLMKLGDYRVQSLFEEVFAFMDAHPRYLDNDES